MSQNFQDNDPSLESQWRSLILFGKNSATYKFAFGKALLDFITQEKTTVSLKDIAPLYAKSILSHLTENDKQGAARSSTFLNSCREYLSHNISYDQLLNSTEKYGFQNVIDAFQNINGGTINDLFYHKDFSNGNKNIILTDNLLSLKESVQFINLEQEIEARWKLVETAWNLNINPNALHVQYDDAESLLFVENNLMRRKNLTSVRDALNGYQKGKCFFSFKDISIVEKHANICSVDHFLPHAYKAYFSNNGININGIWNLVLVDTTINGEKSSKIPEIQYLERLHKRNEFYITSKHPLGETIINQTGKTLFDRRKFLQNQYDLCLNLSIQRWKPSTELEALF